jgi:hypothetical protein
MAGSLGGQLRVSPRSRERAALGPSTSARGPSSSSPASTRGVDAQTPADPCPTARLFSDRGSSAGCYLGDAYP